MSASTKLIQAAAGVDTVVEFGESVNFISNTGLTVTAATTIPMTGSWTIESWLQFDLTDDGYWMDFRNRESGDQLSNVPLSFFIGEELTYSNSGSGDTVVSTGISSNVWFHLAAVHISGVTKIYVDGIEKASITDTAGYVNPNEFSIAKRFEGTTSNLASYITNFRISSTGIYTGNFTVPTEPLPVLASTEVLVCAADTFIDRSGNNHTVSLFGTPVISTESPF